MLDHPINTIQSVHGADTASSERNYPSHQSTRDNAVLDSIIFTPTLSTRRNTETQEGVERKAEELFGLLWEDYQLKVPTEEQMNKYGVLKLLEVRIRKALDKAVERMRGIKVRWPESKLMVEGILGTLKGVVGRCRYLLLDFDEGGLSWEYTGLREAVMECEQWLREVEGKKKVLEEEEMLIAEKVIHEHRSVLVEPIVENNLEREPILEEASNPEQELIAEKESITEAKDTAAEEKLGASTSSVLSLLRESRPKYKCEECREIFDRVSRLKSHLCDSSLGDGKARTEGSQKEDTELEKAIIEGLVITDEKSSLGTLAMSPVKLDKGKEEVKVVNEVIECEEKADKQQILYVKEVEV